MTRHVRILLATALSLCGASFSAHAHHAYGRFFDLCTSVTVEGRVGNVQWTDPHVWIDLETDDGTRYAAEWTSTWALARAGLAADVLKPGDRVVVTGSPPLDPAMRRNQTAKVVSALTQIRRPSDDWRWGRATPAPDCARP
jgi:hypothetical protein